MRVVDKREVIPDTLREQLPPGPLTVIQEQALTCLTNHPQKQSRMEDTHAPLEFTTQIQLLLWKSMQLHGKGCFDYSTLSLFLEACEEVEALYYVDYFPSFRTVCREKIMQHALKILGGLLACVLFFHLVSQRGCRKVRIRCNADLYFWWRSAHYRLVIIYSSWLDFHEGWGNVINFIPSQSGPVSTLIQSKPLFLH